MCYCSVSTNIESFTPQAGVLLECYYLLREVKSLNLVIGETHCGIIVGKVLGLVAEGFEESRRLKGVLPSMSYGPLSFDQGSPYIEITLADFQLGLGIPLRDPGQMLLE
jgi:hypothetical protein